MIHPDRFHDKARHTLLVSSHFLDHVVASVHEGHHSPLDPVGFSFHFHAEREYHRSSGGQCPAVPLAADVELRVFCVTFEACEDVLKIIAQDDNLTFGSTLRRCTLAIAFWVLPYDERSQLRAPCKGRLLNLIEFHGFELREPRTALEPLFLYGFKRREV